MKYSTDAAIEEILRRGKKIRVQKQSRKTRALGVSMFFFSIALVTTVSYFSNTGIEHTPTYYGSFVISNEVSPFVFTAVVAFFIGILTTILFKCFYKKPKKDYKQNDTNGQTGEK